MCEDCAGGGDGDGGVVVSRSWWRAGVGTGDGGEERWRIRRSCCCGYFRVSNRDAAVEALRCLDCPLRRDAGSGGFEVGSDGFVGGIVIACVRSLVRWCTLTCRSRLSLDNYQSMQALAIQEDLDPLETRVKGRLQLSVCFVLLLQPLARIAGRRLS